MRSTSCRCANFAVDFLISQSDHRSICSIPRGHHLDIQVQGLQLCVCKFNNGKDIVTAEVSVTRKLYTFRLQGFEMFWVWSGDLLDQLRVVLRCPTVSLDISGPPLPVSNYGYTWFTNRDLRWMLEGGMLNERMIDSAFSTMKLFAGHYSQTAAALISTSSLQQDLKWPQIT